MEPWAAVFEPLEVAGTTFPNRIVRTAHGTRMPWVDRSDDLIDYHVARARGGVGMSVLETASVHPTAPRRIAAHDDSVIPGYRRISEAVHREGMLLFQQLWHGGATVSDNPVGGPPWSASAVPNPMIGIVPRPMTSSMIAEVVDGFAAAARRCREGGLDGVEVHAAHGYLLGQFLSPATNQRDDEYGGSLPGRARFLLEVLAAIRAEVGADFPVSVRLSADDQIEDGIGVHEAAEVARLVEPHVDIVNVSLGSYYRFHRMLESGDGGPLGYELPTSEVVTAAVDVATIVTGRIMTLDHAADVLESGRADLVSMVRATIADPDLVAKSRRGQAPQVRPCVGTNIGCVGGRLVGGFGCILNPTATGVELVVPASTRRTVLVVGGGPAGLEAARAAALRGHRVHLHEARRQLGGQLAVASSAPHRSDLAAAIGWWRTELERLGVSVVLGSFVDPDVVERIAPDVVVAATGSRPPRDGRCAAVPAYALPGARLPHVADSFSLLGFGGSVSVGADAVVYDDTSTWEAISVAEELLRQGARTTLVTRHDTFGSTLPEPAATTQAARERLAADPRFSVVAGSILREITAHDVAYSRLLGPVVGRIPAGTVVLVGHHERERDLGEHLAELGGVEVHIVGDADSGQTIRDATRQAHRVALSL